MGISSLMTPTLVRRGKWTTRPPFANAQRGTARGSRTIYQRELGSLREVARRIVRNSASAEDVVHDAFAQILRDAGNFDPARGSARAWIHSIVRHTALQNRHRAGRELALEPESFSSLRQEPHVSAECPMPEEAAIDVRKCVEQMEPKRRTILLLAIVDGRTHAEIAAHLGVPIGTVKAWIRRELVRLRARLE